MAPHIKTLAILLVLLPLPATADSSPRPAWILQVPTAVADVYIADASGATLHRFANESTGLQWRQAYYMSVGQNGIRKEREWDKRTPVGAYFITEELDTTPLHERYGIAAFPLDYPNTWDRLKNRTGHGIWLHGVDRRNPQRPPMDTDGCLALPNEALASITASLEPLRTPVLVTNSMRWVDAQTISATRDGLRAALEKWRSSQQDGDLGPYLALFSDEFSHAGLGKAHWGSLQLQSFAAREFSELAVEDLYLLADPGEDNLFLSRFTLVSASGDRVLRHSKRIYWKRLNNGEFRIVAMGNG